MIRRIVHAVALSAAIMAPGTAWTETWTIAAPEWRPFAGPELPRNGAAIHALRRALARVGVQVRVRFVPFSRAKEVARTNPKVIGYYPTWPSAVGQEFFASQPVFSSPLGFATSRAKGFDWSQPGELSGAVIATVDQYRYPHMLRRLIRTGRVDAIKVANDFVALRMLQKCRVDAVAIDKFVMRYLLNTRREFRGFRARAQFAERLLSRPALVLALHDTPGNERRARVLRHALAQSDPRTIVQTYLGLMTPSRTPGPADAEDRRHVRPPREPHGTRRQPQ